MNVSNLQQNTGAFGFPTMWVVWTRKDDGLTTVSDVQTLTWTMCNSTDVFPADPSECPPNNVEGMGTVLHWVLWFVIIAFWANMQKNSGPGAARVQKGKLPAVPWAAVFLYWVCNFWLAITISLLIAAMPSKHPTSISHKINTIGVSFVIMVLFWDCLLWLVKKYCRRHFFQIIALYAFSAGTAALKRAYTPSVVAVVGHHVLILGFINFLLGIPKATAKKVLLALFRCSVLPEGYTMGWYEILTPIADLFAEDANGPSEHAKPLIAGEGASQSATAAAP